MRFYIWLILVVIIFIFNPADSYSQINYNVKVPKDVVVSEGNIVHKPLLNNRIAIEQIKNPYWLEQHGQNDEAKLFWDRDTWYRNLNEWSAYGYNGIFSDYSKNRDHPGDQEIIWGLADYPITPEAFMRNIKRLGEESLREAELALKTVKKNIN